MPAQSTAQRRLFAIAEHNPSALYDRNKGLAKLPHSTLHDFAATKESGLPKRVPHMATGTVFQQSERTRGSAPAHHMADGGIVSKWGQKAFAHAGEKGHSLHDTLHVPRDQPIPKYRVRAAAKSEDPKKRHQAQAALNMNRNYYGSK